jgi:hypothetical protein
MPDPHQLAAEFNAVNNVAILIGEIIDRMHARDADASNVERWAQMKSTALATREQLQRMLDDET